MKILTGKPVISEYFFAGTKEGGASKLPSEIRSHCILALKLNVSSKEF